MARRLPRLHARLVLHIDDKFNAREAEMMKKSMMAVACVLALSVTGPAVAQKALTFALVPKNMNNPFFDQARDGCMRAQKELNGVTCEYIGPPEHGGGEEQLQIVQDLIARHVDGLVISPANAAAMARILARAKESGIPVMTFDSDLLDKDRGLRIAYVGTKNYDIGVNLAKQVMAIKPKGGTICIQSGGAAADNHNERMQGIRDTLSGQASKSPPGDRMTGQNGWTEAAGCPLYTDDDFQRAVNQLEDTLNRNSELDAFVPTGGFPQFLPQAYRNVVQKYKTRIAEKKLALVVADTLPPQIQILKEGLSSAQVGQRPFEMGYKAMFLMKDLKDGKTVQDPTYTGLDVCTPQNADTCVAGGS
jgi:ribose transport system substrate-binding protein